ncbi:hypothetical protein B0H10DRAFT_1965981 [Mycena sp. CBHHK59/15]|nr:hypothetical protein B0H10DRAFT_1965981 [Mycena sp. CBHHK59/15]
MPELFRGHDPDPTNTKKKKKARSVSPVQSNVSDSDDEDIDTATIIQQSDDMELKDLTVPSQPPKASQGQGTDLLRYFWPRYALPVLPSTALSACDAISSAGMRLVSLVYDARKTIMNLGTVSVEFEPLLHTSLQIYICKQWNGITQVPRGLSSPLLSWSWNMIAYEKDCITIVVRTYTIRIKKNTIKVVAYSQGPTKEEGEEADLHRQIQNRIGIQAKFDRSHPWLFSLIYIHIITGSSISIHVHVIVRFCGASEVSSTSRQAQVFSEGSSAISERKLNSMHLKDMSEWTFNRASNEAHPKCQKLALYRPHRPLAKCEAKTDRHSGNSSEDKSIP